MKNTLYLPKDFVVRFAEKDTREGESFEIACDEDDIEINEAPIQELDSSELARQGRATKSYCGPDTRLTNRSTQSLHELQLH